MASADLSRPAVFLDRDGTIIEDVDHLSDPEQVRLNRGIPHALAALKHEGFVNVVVSNQAGVAKGLFTLDAIGQIQARIDEQLRSAGGRGELIDGWYYCPHHPDGVVDEYALACECRKPQPGMLLAAAADLDLDLDSSYLIGNMWHDIVAAERAGVRGILIDTTPTKADADPSKGAATPWARVADVPEAAGAILSAIKAQRS